MNIVSLVLTHTSNAETCHLIITKEVLEVVVMLKDWITFKVLPAGDSLFLRHVTWKRGEIQHSSLRVLMYSAKIRKTRGKTVLRALLSGDDKTCWSFKSATLKENFNLQIKWMLYRGKISQKLRHKQIISALKSTAIINLGKAIILFLCGTDTRHKSMQRLIRGNWNSL